jgi:hypothetical protein
MTLCTIADTIHLTTGASTTIRPSSASEEYIIHNIYVEDGKSAKVEFGDGTNWVVVDTITMSLLAMYFHCTRTDYLRLTNMEGDTQDVAYDGIIIT